MITLSPEVKRYEDFPRVVQEQDTRTWGVQILVLNENTVWIQDDVDSADRIEAHVLGDEVKFLNSTSRLNSVSGGKKRGETIEQAALRELAEETGIQGSGELIALEHVPVFACFQAKKIEDCYSGLLMGGLVAIYKPSKEEARLLALRGDFVPFSEAALLAETDYEGKMRPAFRLALQLINYADTGGDIDEIVQSYNMLVAQAVSKKCEHEQWPLLAGIFV